MSSVPTTVRIASACDAGFVARFAGKQVELSHLTVTSDVKRLVLRRDVHRTHWFRCRSFEDVHQIGVHVSLRVYPLCHLVNVTCRCGGEVDGDDLLVGDVSVDDEAREDDVTLVEDRSSMVLRDCGVHERVSADEVEDRVRQGLRVVDADAGSRVGYLGRQDGKPS